MNASLDPAFADYWIRHLLRVEDTIFVLARPFGVPSYDFDFERSFACTHPVYLPENVEVIARVGPIADYEAVFPMFEKIGLRLVNDPAAHGLPTREGAKEGFHWAVFYEVEADVTSTSSATAAGCYMSYMRWLVLIGMCWFGCGCEHASRGAPAAVAVPRRSPDPCDDYRRAVQDAVQSPGDREAQIFNSCGCSSTIRTSEARAAALDAALPSWEKNFCKVNCCNNCPPRW